MAITGGPARLTAGKRIHLTYENTGGTTGNKEIIPEELAVSSSDSVFGFLEGSVESMASSDGIGDNMFDLEEEEEVSENSLEENKSFWENQHNLLVPTICRTTSLETGIRNVTKQAVNELQAEGNNNNYCKCGKSVVMIPVAGNNCRSCLMREVSSKLRNAGYDTAVCRSKWRTSPEIPSGEHTFIDVIDNSNPKKGEVRVIIELNFRAEFEMARASEEYNKLISRLPEIFVAKIERLKTLIKIVSTAAKKCMKDKKMHMGPWRKQRYMHAKWFSNTCERITEVNVPKKGTNSKQMNYKPARASMLTMALLDIPRNAVAAA